MISTEASSLAALNNWQTQAQTTPLYGQNKAWIPTQDRGGSRAHHAEHGYQGRKRQAGVQCKRYAHVSGDHHYAVGASVHAWSATDHSQTRNGPSIDRKAGLGRDGFRGKSASGLCAGQIPPARCSAARTNVVFTNSYVDNNSSLICE
jgi:hypothetical protein